MMAFESVNGVHERMMKAVYVIACVLLLLAIVGEGVAKHHARLGATGMAKATSELARTGTDADYSGARASARHHAQVSDLYSIISLVLAGLGVLSWVVSLFGQRRNPIGVPVGLLIIYIVTMCLLV